MSKKPDFTTPKNIKGTDFDIYVSRIRSAYSLGTTEIIFRQKNTPDFYIGFIYDRLIFKKEIKKTINDKLELVYMAYTEYSNNNKK